MFRHCSTVWEAHSVIVTLCCTSRFVQWFTFAALLALSALRHCSTFCPLSVSLLYPSSSPGTWHPGPPPPPLAPPENSNFKPQTNRPRPSLPLFLSGTWMYEEYQLLQSHFGPKEKQMWPKEKQSTSPIQTSDVRKNCWQSKFETRQSNMAHFLLRLLSTSFHFFPLPVTKSCLKIVDSRPTQVILEIGRKRRVVFFGFAGSGKTLCLDLEVLENQQVKQSTLPQDLSRIWMHCRLCCELEYNEVF